jgi:hypothetical protein
MQEIGSAVGAVLVLILALVFTYAVLTQGQ